MTGGASHVFTFLTTAFFRLSGNEASQDASSGLKSLPPLSMLVSSTCAISSFSPWTEVRLGAGLTDMVNEYTQSLQGEF